MTSWRHIWSILVLTLVIASALGVAFVLAWNADSRLTTQRLAPPPLPAAVAEPNVRLESLPTKCKTPEAVVITDAQAWENRPKPELSVRTNDKAGRTKQIELALLVDAEGHVVCADAIYGFPTYRARAAELAMLWRFKPFEHNEKPVLALIYQSMPVRWLDARPQVRVPFPQVSDWRSLRITLTRSGCYGTCPDYEVRIFGDGKVEYEGRAFVALLGRHRALLPQEAIKMLHDQFRRADFFWLNDIYAAQVTDSPQYTLEIAYDGHKKRVRDYVGLWVAMPDAVTNLEQAIDDTVDSERWTRGNKNTAQSLINEGWNFRSRSRENLAIVPGLARYGESSALREVIAVGAPVTARVDAEQLRLQPGAKTTALDVAVRRGDPQILRLLLSAARWHSTDLNEALLLAAIYGRLSIVMPLLTAGANPHYVTARAAPPNTGATSPTAGYPGPGNGSQTVLMMAAASGMPDVVELILKSKPNINARDNNGWTPLRYAIDGDGPSYRDSPAPNRARVVELLIAAGADPSAAPSWAKPRS